LNERFFGIDRRRVLPKWARRTLAELTAGRSVGDPDVLLFNDTFTNYYEPDIGVAALDVLNAAGVRAGVAPNVCCGRPLISKGFLEGARQRARENVERLYPAAAAGKKIAFCEPSCLSAVREDAPSLLRGEEQRRGTIVAQACVSFEELLESELASGRARLTFNSNA
jgi:Fe-S oxidoreductase